MFAPPMNSIISSLSSPLHSFHTYADPQEPAKILARAHQELNHRFLQERLLQVTSPSLLSNPLLISNPPPPPSLGSHYFPGAPNFVPPFLSPLANPHSIVLQSILNSANPYPASSKLTSLQAEQRHLMPSHADLTMAAPSPGHLFPNFPSQLSVNSSTPERSFQKDLVAGAFRPKDYLSNFNTLFNSMGFYPAPSISNVDRSKHTFKKRKSTRWSIAHVKIAWEIHMDQQKKLSTTTTTTAAPSLTSSSSSTPSKKLAPDKNDCENSSLSGTRMGKGGSGRNGNCNNGGSYNVNSGNLLTRDDSPITQQGGNNNKKRKSYENPLKTRDSKHENDATSADVEENRCTLKRRKQNTQCSSSGSSSGNNTNAHEQMKLNNGNCNESSVQQMKQALTTPYRISVNEESTHTRQTLFTMESIPTPAMFLNNVDCSKLFQNRLNISSCETLSSLLKMPEHLESIPGLNVSSAFSILTSLPSNHPLATSSN